MTTERLGIMLPSAIQYVFGNDADKVDFTIINGTDLQMPFNGAQIYFSIEHLIMGCRIEWKAIESLQHLTTNSVITEELNNLKYLYKQWLKTKTQ